MKRLTLLAVTASALLAAGGTIARVPRRLLDASHAFADGHRSSITVGGATQSGAVNVVSTRHGRQGSKRRSCFS